MQPSARGQAIPGSATLTISAKAGALRAKGVDVVALSVGQPDFPTPQHIVDAAKRALDEGAHGYTPSAGIPELREAVAAELTALTGQTYGVKNVLVSTGAKYVLHELMQALVDPGDEVILPAPYWVSYPHMVGLAEGRLRVLQTRLEDGFRLQPAQLQEALTEKSRVLILNSPSNPTGAAYTEADLRGLAEVVLSHPRLVVLSDEIYRKLVYGGFQHVSFAALGPEAAARTFVVDGVSKSYAMTGWRIGYGAGDAEVMAAATRYQDHTTSCPAAVSQHAALAALTGSQDVVETMRQEFERRMNILLEKVQGFDTLDLHPPQGAFYAFVRVVGLGDAAQDDVALCERLLEEAHTACVPGSAFGAPGHLRISFAAATEQIVQGLDRIHETLGRIRQES